MSPVPAEHARFHSYLRALSQVSDAGECELLATVLSDPDQAMAESAVLRHLDRKAAALDDAEAFAQWHQRIARVVNGHELPDHRLRDWALLKTIASARPWNVADLREASNWLQRKLAERTRSTEALAVLAEHGRTNRIRTVARSRLDRRTA